MYKLQNLHGMFVSHMGTKSSEGLILLLGEMSGEGGLLGLRKTAQSLLGKPQARCPLS